MTDRDPLLEKEGSPSVAMDDQNFLPDVIFFLGKELRTGVGMRQSFIRKPGTEQVLVRIGIGREGVFKVDGMENKILENWPFSDLKDWSFSGYSFTLRSFIPSLYIKCLSQYQKEHNRTLQFSSSNKNYSVRTDDGEAICSYIDDFQKHPEEALKRARDNPPNSKIPESGVQTLRRKFSREPSQNSAADQVKFYTMNRRPKKNSDPTSKLSVDVDSRLRDAYAHNNVSPDPEPIQIEALAKERKEGKVNGVLPSPTSTKGESTENVATQPPPPSSSSPSNTKPATSSSSSPPSAPPSSSHPPPPKQQNSEPSLPQIEPKPANISSKEPGLVPDDPNDYFLLRQRSVSETTVQRGNARPINLVKPVTMPWGSNASSSGVEISGNRGTKSHTIGPIQQRQGSTPGVGTGKPGGSLPSRVLGTSRSTSAVGSSSSGSKVDSTQEGGADGGEGGTWYQSPATPEDGIRARLASPPYDTLSRSDSGMSMELGQGIQIQSLKSENTSNSMDNFQITLPSPPSSPGYDHLPPTSPQEKSSLSLSAPVDIPMRRNVSQPAMRGEKGGVTTPNSNSPAPDSIAEEDEDDSEDETSTSLDHSGVVRRQKKSSPSRNESDPFEDLLGTPQAVARLRWSQELNPLYDFIKGMKISESISSQEQGIKLYSASAPVSDKKLKKLPSTIFEEKETTPSPKHTAAVVPVIALPEEGPATEDDGGRGEVEEEDEEEEREEGDKIPMIIPENKSSRLPRAPRRQHNYEEVGMAPRPGETMTTSIAGLIQPPPIVKKMKENAAVSSYSGGSGSVTLGARVGGIGGVGGGSKSSLAALTNPAVRRLQTIEGTQERSGSVSPRLGKRELQRRSRTVSCMDDTEAVTRKQKPLRAADMMKDFSLVMREFRLFYIKMPNGYMHSEVCNINRPVSELREKLCDLIGVDNADHYQLYMEGACLTSLKEGEGVEGLGQGGVTVGRSNSLTHIVDHQWLPDLGSEPLLLKPSLSFHMQGITTSRVLALMCDDVLLEAGTNYPSSIPPSDEAEEFHKHWISIVQGNIPCTTEQAVNLAAIQYQAYFLDRTAVHSVVGFCRPNEFLPTEFSGIRGLEQKMYKEQEKLKMMKTHKEVHVAYVNLMSHLPTYNTVFFPVREPRKKVLQSTKLKPILLGVGSQGITRVDPKTKEVLDHWDYQVLRNWAYSRKTFVLAFTDKNYPVESNQAKWISMMVDFFVDSIITTGSPPATANNKS